MGQAHNNINKYRLIAISQGENIISEEQRWAQLNFQG